MKWFYVISLILLLSHCSSVPQSPHCHDNGKGLKPVNHAPTAKESVRGSKHG